MESLLGVPSTSDDESQIDSQSAAWRVPRLTNVIVGTLAAVALVAWVGLAQPALGVSHDMHAIGLSSGLRGLVDSPFDENGCAGAACGSLDDTEFDFIVVGSGPGGGTAAARLAEEGHSVLVLEAGLDSGARPEYFVPIQHAAASEADGLAWKFFVRHYSNDTYQALDTKLTDEGIFYPRGSTVGGSSAVNAMIQVLPKISDWDRLASLTGDETWAPKSMSKMEDLLKEWLPQDNIPIGNIMPDVSHPEFRNDALDRLLTTFDTAYDEMGFAGVHAKLNESLDPVDKLKAYTHLLRQNVNDHLRKGVTEGGYPFPQMIKNGKRFGIRDRLLQALSTGKLTIKTHALVHKVVFSNAKEDGGCDGVCEANEVLYLHGRGLYGAEIKPSKKDTPKDSRAKVRKGGEIIIAGGAFNTPQILKQSGIGPRAELDRFDIPVLVDLVGVGENLQDRYEVSIKSEYRDETTNEPLPFLHPKDSDVCASDYAKSATGFYAQNGALISFLKRSGHTKSSDLHIFSFLGDFKGYVPGYAATIPRKGNVHSWLILKGLTDNRGGTVKLRCAEKKNGKCVVDPRSQPDINFHYFHEGDEYDEEDESIAHSKGGRDLKAVTDAVEMVRRMNKEAEKRLNNTKVVEVWPGKEFAPDENFASERERLDEWVKREAWGHHASCSAPMGCIPSDEVDTHNKGAGVCKKTKFNKKTVIDSRFHVRGTTGLRVVDASAWPRIPGTFLLLPTYMLGEKGAATIIEDHKKD